MSEPTMRAVVQHAVGGPEVLRVERVPRPEPLPTEVLVRVHAAGINPVDWKTRAGTGIGMGPPPFTLGWDVSGVVERVGFGVTTLREGDEVYGMPWFPRAANAYAEFVTAPSRQFARKPTSLSHEQAAAVPLAGLTAWQILVDAAKVTKGQRVLIHAAGGGVGHLAVQFAKHLGAHVIGTATSARHDWLRDLGADELVDYTAVRFEDAVEVVDVVVDLVGDGRDATSTRSLDVLRPGGLIVAVPSGVSTQLHEAATARGLRASAFLVEPDGPGLARIAALIDAGEVRVEVEEVYPLEQVPRPTPAGKPTAPAASSFCASQADHTGADARIVAVRLGRRSLTPRVKAAGWQRRGRSPRHDSAKRTADPYDGSGRCCRRARRGMGMEDDEKRSARRSLRRRIRSPDPCGQQNRHRRPSVIRGRSTPPLPARPVPRPGH